MNKKEKYLIIYCHPFEKSFNHSIKQRVEENLKESNKLVHTIDLYKDKFNPVYDNEELSLFRKGETTDEIVKEYQHFVRNATKIIAIFPIWWNDCPGIMKGFFDKVMKMNFAYKNSDRGVIGLLDQIESFTVITTSSSPTWYLKFFAGNAIQSVLLDGTIKQLGIKNRKWINLGSINKKSETQRKEFLSNLKI